MTFAFPVRMLFPSHESRDTGSTGVLDVICVFHGLSGDTYTKKKTCLGWRGDGDVVVGSSFNVKLHISATNKMLRQLLQRILYA